MSDDYAAFANKMLQQATAAMGIPAHLVTADQTNYSSIASSYADFMERHGLQPPSLQEKAEVLGDACCSELMAIERRWKRQRPPLE